MPTNVETHAIERIIITSEYPEEYPHWDGRFTVTYHLDNGKTHSITLTGLEDLTTYYLMAQENGMIKHERLVEKGTLHNREIALINPSFSRQYQGTEFDK